MNKFSQWEIFMAALFATSNATGLHVRDVARHVEASKRSKRPRKTITVKAVQS
jgi:hypothetical protein